MSASKLPTGKRILNFNSMNYCPNCGNELESGVKFCPNCGQKITNDEELVQTPIHIEVEDTRKELAFPEFPAIMNVGKQIANWKGDAYIPNAFFSYDVNSIRAIPEGKVGVAAHTNGICIIGGTSFYYIHHMQIVNMSCVKGEQLISKDKSVIGRAAVGAILLGPLGAIIGGMSGIGSKVKKVGKFFLVINYWDVVSHQVQTLLVSMTDEYVQFIKRAEEEKEKNNTPEGNNYVINIHCNNGDIDSDKVIAVVKKIGAQKLAMIMESSENIGFQTAMQKIRDIAKGRNIDLKKYKSYGCMIASLIIGTSFIGLATLIGWGISLLA